MIGLSTTQRYYLYRHPTDMRKSLCAMNAGNSNANYEMRDRPLGTGRWMLAETLTSGSVSNWGGGSPG